jgi:hypothetical protein
MSEDVFERLRRSVGSNGQSTVNPEDVEKLKKAATGINVPMVSLNQKTYMPMVPVPEIKAISRDRRGRREADEARRQLARIAWNATRTGVAIEAIRSVNTFAVHSLDRTQEETMGILFGHTRHEGMNEFMAQIVGQVLQLTVAQVMALAEHHGKRQMEEL